MLTIPRQRDRVTHRPPTQTRAAAVLAVTVLAMEVARGAALACGAVVGAGVGVMVLDWLA